MTESAIVNASAWRRSISCWTGRNLVVRELDGNAHLFENTDRVASKVLCNVEWSEIEVTAGIDRRWIVDALEEEELHLWMNVEGETALRRLVQIAPEDETRVAPERPAIGRMDITEHAGHAPVGPSSCERHDLKSSRIGSSQHVRLLHPCEPLDGRTVKTDPLIERLLQLLRGHGERLQKSEDVREPEPNEPDTPLLDSAQNVILLSFHGGKTTSG